MALRKAVTTETVATNANADINSDVTSAIAGATDVGSDVSGGDQGSVTIDGADGSVTQGVEVDGKKDDGKEPEIEPANEEPVTQVAKETSKGAKAENVEVKPEVKPEIRSTEVSTNQGETRVAVAGVGGGVMAEFKADLAKEGFEGMEVTGMSFERIRLHEGKFKIGMDDSDLGLEFNCQILSTREIYVVRQSTDQEAEMYYSYDPAGKVKADGTSAEETLAEWRVDGYGVEGHPLEIKKYMEVMAILKGRDDEYDEMVVSLSIPPASLDRIAGVAFTAKQKFKALPSGVITNCKVGKEVGEGKKKFRPWIFKVTHSLEQFEAAQAQ